jgi:hypothetical protein
LASAYNLHADNHGRTGLTKNAFGLAFKRARPYIEDGQRTVNGKPRMWCYIGIGLKNDDGGDDGTDETEPPSGSKQAAETRNVSNASNASSLFVSDLVSKREQAKEESKSNNKGKSVTRVTLVTPEGSDEPLTTNEVQRYRQLVREGMSPKIARSEILAKRRNSEVV